MRLHPASCQGIKTEEKMKVTKFRGKRLRDKQWVVGDLIENRGRCFIYHAISETTLADNGDGLITVVAEEVDSTTVGGLLAYCQWFRLICWRHLSH